MYKLTENKKFEGIVFDDNNFWSEIINIVGSGIAGCIFASQVNFPLNIKDGVFAGFTFVSLAILGSSVLEIAKHQFVNKRSLLIQRFLYT